MAGLTLSFSLWPPFGGGPGDFQGWLATVSPWLILGLGVYFFVRHRRAEPSKNFHPLMAMQVAYLANAAFCLIGFFRDWQVGAYCVLAAAVAYLLQIVLTSVQGRVSKERGSVTDVTSLAGKRR